MAWRVGIDEAGYGPNLGPLVMSAVACRVPEEHASTSLWKVLKSAVRKASGRGEAKLPVDDSKKIYSTARGLGDLERSVLAILHGTTARPETVVPNGPRGQGPVLAATGAALSEGDPAPGATSAPFFEPGLSGFIARLCPRHELTGESWYRGGTALPVATAADDIAEAGARFFDCCAEAGAQWCLFRSVIVCPARFNAMVERWGSKGAVLGIALAELVEELLPLQPDEPMHIVVDKHGGRNHYQPLLQDAIPGGWVLPLEEGMEESTYDVWGLPRLVRVTFVPRGDAGHFEVALASMLSKYIRELLMIEFNGFWQEHIPDLAPTAGYPGDSRRFFDAIRPALTRLGIAEHLVWRER